MSNTTVHFPKNFPMMNLTMMVNEAGHVLKRDHNGELVVVADKPQTQPQPRMLRANTGATIHRHPTFDGAA